MHHYRVIMAGGLILIHGEDGEHWSITPSQSVFLASAVAYNETGKQTRRGAWQESLTPAGLTPVVVDPLSLRV